jgi:hypothetical protein
MRARNAEPVGSFLRELDEDQAEAFIANLSLLLSHLREPRAQPSAPPAGPAECR